MNTEEADYIFQTPWDAKVYGIDTYEIQSLSEEILKQVVKTPGHYTVKVDPFFSKKILHYYGFYYCDSLIEPYCTNDRIIYYRNENVSISRSVALDDLIKISHGVFYGRFHRDFNLDRRLADLRYDLWLKELYNSGNFYAYFYNEELAGYAGCSENKMVLLALDAKYRGKGLAKYFKSVLCHELFKKGYGEIVSSISGSNLYALNMFASLGFRFRNAVDVYHRLTT